MSAVVADTHSLLWYLNGSSRLSGRAIAAFEDAEQNGFAIYVSAIVLVELRYLIEKGRGISEGDFAAIVDDLDDPTSALTFSPISQSIAEDLGKIPRAIVPDMPDRLIAATAINLNLPLVSRDGDIQKLKNVNVVW